jgi:hypothetical protein
MAGYHGNGRALPLRASVQLQKPEVEQRQERPASFQLVEAGHVEPGSHATWDAQGQE